MPKSHTTNVSEMDPANLEIRFSPEVRAAFGNLSAAVHFSEQFDQEIRAILDDWAAGKPPSLHIVMIAFPAIAGEAAKHTRANNDMRTAEALSEIASQMVEHGFTVTRSRKVAKS